MSETIEKTKPDMAAEAVEAVEASAQLVEFGQREKAVVRKLDLYIASVMMVIMLISYLDRGNIGFAATQGLTEDLNLQGSQLNVAVSVFYVTYVLSEFPASFFVKRFKFHRVIPFLCFGFGTVSLGTGFIHSYAPLVVCRLLLGLFEGAMFASMATLLANWYRREELSTRVGYLFMSSGLSGAFGGLIALGILQMDGIAGYRGWRWLYIIEGIITVVWSIALIKLLPKSYRTAYFLNDDEKEIMRLREALALEYSGGDGHYSMKDIKLAAADSRSWIHGICQISTVTILYGFGTFLPIIIRKGLNYSVQQAQYLVIPVHIWGVIVYYFGALIADRYNLRYWSMMALAPFGVAGYALLLAPVPVGVQYFATFLVSTACYLCTGSNIGWLSGNVAPDGKRAASMGILLALTNIGGIISGQIYQSNSAPRYTLGHAWSMGSICFSACCWTLLYVIYKRREAGKDRERAEGKEVLPEEFTDRSHTFKYQL